MPQSTKDYQYSGLHQPGKGVNKTAPSTRSHKVSRPKRDWKKYNKDLIERGNVCRFVRMVVKRGPWVEHTGKQGRPRYSDEAITTCYMLMSLLNLTCRGCQGYLQGLFELLHWDPSLVPSASTISRRAGSVLFRAPTCTKIGHTRVVDGTGFGFKMRGPYASKKYGEPEKRRKFALATISTDAKTGLITALAVTPDRGVGNGEVSQLPALLGQEVYPVKVLMGDGAYDTQNVYSECKKRGITLIAPPQINAKYGLNDERDICLVQIGRIGPKEWKKRIGYHTRSLAESTNWALKSAFGDKTRATSFKGAQARIIAHVLVYNLWLMDALA